MSYLRCIVYDHVEPEAVIGTISITTPSFYPGRAVLRVLRHIVPFREVAIRMMLAFFGLMNVVIVLGAG